MGVSHVAPPGVLVDTLAVIAWLLALLQLTAPGAYRLSLPVRGAEPLQYALSLPRGYDGTERRPLVLALHPGGPRTPGYGAAFMGQVILPALYDFDPIVIAPDCPTQSWTDPAAEQAVLQLVKHVMSQYAVNPRQVLVTGFSMGGRGTWFMSSRHSTLFTGAIVMAGSAGSFSTDTLARIPTYVIHSREDEVVPFEPAERMAASLEKLGRPVRFEALDGPGHFDMSEYVAPLERAAAWIVSRWK